MGCGSSIPVKPISTMALGRELIIQDSLKEIASRTSEKTLMQIMDLGKKRGI
jgi:hypothetical protein